MYIYVGIIVKWALIFVFALRLVFILFDSVSFARLSASDFQLHVKHSCLRVRPKILMRLVYMQLSDFCDIFLCELKVVRLSLSMIKTLGLSVFLSLSWSVNSTFARLCF